MFCVYLTCYYGNKLPPFYIGYSLIEKVNNGYHGSVCSKRYKQIWESEIKLNPHLFKTKILVVCNNRNEAVAKEQKFQNHLKVISNPMYINCAIGRNMINENPPWNIGIKYTEEQRNKLKVPKSVRTKEHSLKNGKASGITRKGMKIGKYSKIRIDRGRPQFKLCCPFCNKTGGYASMSRWHFNNCKSKNE